MAIAITKLFFFASSRAAAATFIACSSVIGAPYGGGGDGGGEAGCCARASTPSSNAAQTVKIVKLNLCIFVSPSEKPMITTLGVSGLAPTRNTYAAAHTARRLLFLSIENM